MKTSMTHYEKTLKFEELLSAYIAKRKRIDELKSQGRCGYQLRMPKKALSIAYRNLETFMNEIGEDMPF